MRDYLLMPELGTIKKTVDKQNKSGVCEKCKGRRQLYNNVNKDVLKPVTKLNNKTYVNNDRQNKIDNFIIHFAYRGLQKNTRSRRASITRATVPDTRKKHRGWRWFTKCPGTSPVKMNFNNLLRWRGRGRINPEENKIQQIDGGFFERFGSLLREQSVLAEEEERLEKEEVAAKAAEIKIDEETDEEEVPKTTDDVEQILNETDAEAPRDSDSEPEETDKSEYIGVGWNIDELYIEVLYEILHNVGCDVSCEIGQTALFSYVQDAFKMINEKHAKLMSVAEEKEAPEILLNVEIIEAKELMPKDSNGLSDPFVTLYLASNASHRYNTSVKPATLDPVWEEHFALPVSDNASEDTLCLEVWDFDPAETVREKMGKFLEVKGVRGLRKLVKEIAITATTGQHENELIGKACIPLKAIPASGMTMWYSLDKKNRMQRRGVVKVRLAFSSEKNCQVAAQEHRYLLKILLLHELELSKVCAYWWCGNFSPQAEALVTQHSAQSGLNPLDIAVAQWNVYCTVHVDHQLSFTLFSKLLEKLMKPLQTSTLCEEDVKLFWDATKKLLPSCFSIVRKIRKKTCGDKNMMKQLLEVLRILSKLSSLEPPENTNLFPSNIYGWLTYKDDGPNCDIKGTLSDAVIQGATDWFNHILENNACQENTDECKLQHLIKIINLVRTDLQKAVEFYDKTFQQEINFQYARTLYTLYQGKLAVLIEPDVTSVCRSLKKVTYPTRSYQTIVTEDPDEPLSMGTTLFELYLVLQRFVVLGHGLCPTSYDNFQIREFHLWFHGGVAQWLDIAVFKALQRIQKAVELDSLVPVDSSVKYSSSAVDTLAIFYQVKIFWQQLNWPDVEGSYTFVAKIIDDICRCCVFYADHMSNRVEGMGDVQDTYEKKFEVTSEWCLAINNIDYVRQSLTPFAEELGVEDIVQKLSDLRSPLEAQRCRQTLHNVIENSIDTVRNKIIELLDTVANKMSPAMTRLLVEGAEILHQDSNSIDRVMMYLDNNLATLHEQLNEDNFNRILEIIWDHLANILYDLVHSNLEKRRPPSFFSNLHETLKLMIRSFKQSDETADCPRLKQVGRLLELNGMETLELIHQVNLDRWREQKNATDDLYGQLTVKLLFQDNNLLVEIMNARNLKAMDSNGCSDSFVRIHFLPEEKYTNVLQPKTQTHNKTLFPLYDEKFTIALSPEQKNTADGLVLFSVKDKDFLGMSNQYIAEAYVHFSEIPNSAKDLVSISQTLLPLSRPTVTDTESIKALEHRQGDKLARDFLKKYKQKMGSPPK